MEIQLKQRVRRGKNDNDWSPSDMLMNSLKRITSTTFLTEGDVCTDYIDYGDFTRDLYRW